MTSILEKNAVYQADCLELLERIPDRSIQVAYLDPPSASIMLDMISMSIDAYKSLIDKTIRQLHRVLRHEGSIFVQSDLRNANYIRPYLVKYFTEDMYREEFALKNVQGSVEIVIYYAKSNAVKQRSLFKPVSDADFRDFRKDERGELYRLSSLTTLSKRPAYNFEFKGYTPSNQSWKYSRERLAELDKEGLIVLSGSGIPRLKQYLTPDHRIDVTTDWSDVPDEVTGSAEEFLEFESQRPEELLRRIIMTASDIGDRIIDPFCGSGTSLVVAQKTDRKWIGCDISEHAHKLSQRRLKEEALLVSDHHFRSGNSDFIRTRFPVIHRSIYRQFFISYSRRDAEDFVRPFCDELTEAGLDFWRDEEDIPNGSEWRKELNGSLDECEAMILFLSPDALQSPYVEEEWRAFMDQGKPIFQVMCRETYVPPELNRLQRTAFARRQQLIRQLKAMD